MVRLIHSSGYGLKLILSILCFTFVLAKGGSLSAALPAPPLLLSLDVERESDVNALKKLNLKVPATYFVTGEFARSHPEIVKNLAEKGTVGSHSHSHPHLTQIGTDEIRADLLKSAEAIQAATGQKPSWFRAPFLDVNEDVLSVARELGFRFDSSEPERWIQQRILSEMPISINSTDRILFSDYDIFVTYGFDDQMALEIIKENYQSRLVTGRPFIFLLHPSIIAEHADVLHKFISYVHDLGGSNLSFDQYLERIFKGTPINIGVRIDPGMEAIDAKQVIEELIQQKITDAFILTQDNSGNKNFKKTTKEGVTWTNFRSLVHGLHEAGVRVHAWLPVLKNRAVIKQHPDLAMVDEKGVVSKEWISPSHLNTVNNLEQDIIELLDEFPIDGVHLTDIAYPGLNSDFSPAALNQFKADTGISFPFKEAASLLPGKYFNQWISWRFKQIENLTKAAANAALKKRKNITVSAALKTNSLTDFRVMEQTGQDHRLLTQHLDMIVTLPGDTLFADNDFSLTKLLPASRSMVGNLPLMIALPETLAKESKQVKEHILKAIHGADGVIFPTSRSLQLSDITDIIEQTATLSEPVPPLADSNPTKTTEAVKLAANSVFTPKHAQASPKVLPEKQLSSAMKTGNTYSWDGAKILLFVVITGLCLTAFLTYSIRKGRKNNPDQLIDGVQVPLDWPSLRDQFNEGEITGQLVYSVAQYLRTYDPVNTSRFRISFILDMIEQSTEPMNINQALNSAPALPGWHVLAMSHLKEAVMHGYLQLNEDQLSITAKGMQELVSMKNAGFHAEQWLFVEQRLHEILIAECPECGFENATHWYWVNFHCSKCNRDIDFRKCREIYRKNDASVELNHHNIA